MSDDKRGDQKQSSTVLTIAGVIATSIYLIFIGWYWRDQSQSLLALSPNEFGDFLAGVFAPLAFLWLVLGFIQQGIELRNSAKALWLQGQELKNSVEQQRELVEVTREQLKFDSKILEEQRKELVRISMPILKLQQTHSVSAGGKQSRFGFRLNNHGKPCTDLRIIVSKNGRSFEKSSLSTGENFDFELVLGFEGSEEIYCSVSYLDDRLVPGNAKFVIKRDRSAFTIDRELG
ncbi:hypothetical protein EH30_06855 [Erythrobacter sp. JL475]|nr:hypothetical protein EH30_06855 [Erythrobacter sp. JL475]